MAKTVTCKHCGSTEVKKTFLGGAKAVNVIVIFLCIGAISNQYYHSPNPSMVMIFGWIVIIAFLSLGLFSPKYICKSCKKRFS